MTFPCRLALLAAGLALSSAAVGQTNSAPAAFSRADIPNEKRQVSTNEIDSAIADEIATRFEGDRSRFLTHLREQGKTVREYRREVEESLRLRGPRTPAATAATQPEELHLRLIQISRKPDETDEVLLGRASPVISKLKAGESFSDLAKHHSDDQRRARGGDWGWMKRSDFKPGVADVAFQLKKGEASAPIVLPEGCFILFAEDRR